MSDNMENKNTAAASGEEQYSLNDDRRVKVLSPGAMVAKRFFRNRIAVVGLVILAFMFLFSFVGGLITPYGEEAYRHYLRYAARGGRHFCPRGEYALHQAAEHLPEAHFHEVVLSAFQQ